MDMIRWVKQMQRKNSGGRKRDKARNPGDPRYSDAAWAHAQQRYVEAAEPYVDAVDRDDRKAMAALWPRVERARRAVVLIEMAGLLQRYGYSPEHAGRLAEDGMGPEELRGRLRMGTSGVGSLEYTHGIRPNPRLAAARLAAAKRAEKIADDKCAAPTSRRQFRRAVQAHGRAHERWLKAEGKWPRKNAAKSRRRSH